MPYCKNIMVIGISGGIPFSWCTFPVVLQARLSCGESMARKPTFPSAFATYSMEWTWERRDNCMDWPARGLPYSPLASNKDPLQRFLLQNIVQTWIKVLGDEFFIQVSPI